MADRKPYYIRLADTNNVVRIVATSPDEALAKSEKIDPATTPIVVSTNKAEQSALLRDPSGREYVVSPGYSGSSPDVIAKYKEGVTASDLSKSMVRQGVLQEEAPLGRMTGPVVAATQAFGFGAGEWIDEFMEAVGSKDAAKTIRAISEAQRSERPAETLAVQLGVGAAEGYGLLKRFPQLAKLIGGSRDAGLVASMVRGAFLGAPAAAVASGISASGAAQSGERRQKGLEGAVIGGATGGIIGGGTPLAAAGGRNVANIIRKSEVPMIASALRISEKAASVIKSAFDAGGDTETAIENIRRAGDAGMLADAGPAAQALLDASATVGGQGGVVSRAMSERAETVTAGLSKKLDETLGADELTPTQAATMISGKTKDARKTAYDAAYAQPIDYSTQAGRNIEATLDRIDPEVLDSAIKRANSQMRADGKKNQQIKATIGADGEISYETLPNVMQLDYIKRSLNTLAENARTPLGQATDDTLLYGGLARDLRRSVGDAVVDPQTGARLYDDAVKLGGETIAEQNAFKLGREILKPNTELGDVFDEIGAEPSQAQLEALKLGMRQYIRRVLQKVKSVPSDQEMELRQLDAFYRLTSSEDARNKIARVMGDEASELMSEIDKVAQTAKVRSAVNVNSKTAQRQAIERNIEDITSEGFIGELLRGNPLNSTREVVQAITGRTSQYDFEQRQKIFADVARALTETKGPEARVVLDIMERARNGQIVTQAENDLMVNEIAGTLSLIGRGAAQSEVEEMRQ